MPTAATPTRTPCLRVAEIFRSIQGESTLAGLPCVFVRLAGCNLRCRWCDTPYARSGGRRMSVATVLQRVGGLAHDADLVEVTGGEPLLQPATPALLQALARQRPSVLLETNGSLPLPARRVYRVIMDVKCPGSGMDATMDWANLNRLQPGDELKFVIADRTDFDWVLRVVRDRGLAARGVPLLAAPVAGELAPVRLAAWVLESGMPLRVQLQLHRLLWPDRDRGV